MITKAQTSRICRSAIGLTGIVLAVGCMETSDGGSSSVRGSGNDTTAGSANGSLNARSSGGYTFVLSRDGGVCTGVFEDAPVAGATELTTLTCSGSGKGTATLVYGSDATPDRVVYAVNGEGGGTINF